MLDLIAAAAITMGSDTTFTATTTAPSWASRVSVSVPSGVCDETRITKRRKVKASCGLFERRSAADPKVVFRFRGKGHRKVKRVRVSLPPLTPATIPFTLHAPDGQPVGWCGARGPVTVRFSPSVPPARRGQTMSAASLIGQHIGVTFEAGPDTDFQPTWGSMGHGQQREVHVVAVSDATDWDSHGGALAWAAPIHRTGDRSHLEWGGGTVAVMPDASRLNGRRFTALMIHELGHVAGLGHAQGTDSIMSAPFQVLFITPWDAAALQQLADRCN